MDGVFKLCVTGNSAVRNKDGTCDMLPKKRTLVAVAGDSNDTEMHHVMRTLVKRMREQGHEQVWASWTGEIIID